MALALRESSVTASWKASRAAWICPAARASVACLSSGSSEALVLAAPFGAAAPAAAGGLGEPVAPAPPPPACARAESVPPTHSNNATTRLANDLSHFMTCSRLADADERWVRTL